MLLVIIVAMSVIVSAWSMWFFPRNSAEDGEAAFTNFKYDVLRSFSVFTPPAQPKPNDKVNIDDLRSRVFGDAIERFE